MSAPDRPFVVIVDGAKHGEWGRYRTQEEARAACKGLLKDGVLARIVTNDESENRGDSVVAPTPEAAPCPIV